ncbi:translation initiation factor IF-2 N-terminal domain-containing protein [Nocardia niwae]|uniref:Translation initiation factor IF-2 N-terminal domain-containing protein n=1 Tax=Nocardia niwae TaxID=626084 RepID=A0ABV2XDB9_9NOCA
MADQEPLDTTSQDAEQLPERIRVHALAKLLGVTSKRILAKLTEMGADARSAQSNVDRAVAESVRDALVTVEADAAAEQPAAGGVAAGVNSSPRPTATTRTPSPRPRPRPRTSRPPRPPSPSRRSPRRPARARTRTACRKGRAVVVAVAAVAR